MEKKKFNFKNIQGMLSRDEMKQIKGGGCGCLGIFMSAYVVCNNGQQLVSPNQCSNSSNLCNNYGGFQYCFCR